MEVANDVSSAGPEQHSPSLTLSNLRSQTVRRGDGPLREYQIDINDAKESVKRGIYQDNRIGIEARHLN